MSPFVTPVKLLSWFNEMKMYVNLTLTQPIAFIWRHCKSIVWVCICYLIYRMAASHTHFILIAWTQMKLPSDLPDWLKRHINHEPSNNDCYTEFSFMLQLTPEWLTVNRNCMNNYCINKRFIQRKNLSWVSSYIKHYVKWSCPLKRHFTSRTSYFIGFCLATTLYHQQQLHHRT